jgi:Zn-dependent peptidase ImmA (M78 family)
MRWEESDRLPNPQEIQRISHILRFSEDFFFGDDLDEPTVEAASFRSLSTMPARDRDAALAAGSIGFLLDDWVEQRFSLPEHDLEDLSQETPEGAARALREKWSIGERPISHMIHMLEAKGVRVFSLVENTQAVDAFSMWRRNKPYIFLNCQKTAERQRFDAAHELGHLVLHKHGGPHGREAEDEANQFASAFLMPASDVLAIIPHVRDINQMIEAKKRWKVALAALNYRLHRLGASTEWQYRTFCIQIQERGYRKSEPHGIQRETSAVWQKVFDSLRGEKVTKAHIALDLRVPVSEVENLVFGLANMLSFDGEGATTASRKADLRLVVG